MISLNSTPEVPLGKRWRFGKIKYYSSLSRNFRKKRSSQLVSPIICGFNIS